MNDKILANVAGIPVTESEVTGMVSELAARGQNYDNPQGRAVILEQLISNKLLLADARKNLYEHSPEFKAQLEKVKEDLLVNFAHGQGARDRKGADRRGSKSLFRRA